MKEQVIERALNFYQDQYVIRAIENPGLISVKTPVIAVRELLRNSGWTHGNLSCRCDNQGIRVSCMDKQWRELEFIPWSEVVEHVHRPSNPTQLAFELEVPA